MENFFLYISKPVEKEEFQLWVDKNNICYQKFELFSDFVSSLILLIYETYLGNDEDKTTNIRLDQDDNLRHFDWCWNKVINNFAKEKIFFKGKGAHYEFLKNFIIETFYNQKIDEVKYSLGRFFDEIFDLNSIHTMSDLDLLQNIYLTLDKNLENNNLHS